MNGSVFVYIYSVKPILAFILSFTFLLQTFVTVQAMPIHEGKVEMPCSMKQKVSTKHACCTLLTQKENQSEKKGCCTGTSKMSCCTYIIALTPNLQTISFLPLLHQKDVFGYSESQSSFEGDIFHPPTFV